MRVVRVNSCVLLLFLPKCRHDLGKEGSFQFWQGEMIELTLHLLGKQKSFIVGALYFGLIPYEVFSFVPIV